LARPATRGEEGSEREEQHDAAFAALEHRRQGGAHQGYRRDRVQLGHAQWRARLDLGEPRARAEASAMDQPRGRWAGDDALSGPLDPFPAREIDGERLGVRAMLGRELVGQLAKAVGATRNQQQIVSLQVNAVRAKMLSPGPKGSRFDRGATPMASSSQTRRDHLTYKGNLRSTRYGWLRLTPAYSVHLVGEILAAAPPSRDMTVLDPFCGTGTTALVCAERGIAATTTDINPFLIWLARAKTRIYSRAEREAFRRRARVVSSTLRARSSVEPWIPALHQIEKWWDAPTLLALGQAMAEIRRFVVARPGAAGDLLQLAFCRTLIARAQVSFAHQSMSFKRASAAIDASAAGGPSDRGGRSSGRSGTGARVEARAREAAAQIWDEAAQAIGEAARSPILTAPQICLCDARELDTALPVAGFERVITSPPYPNRMSYIRELRPYMYWLGHLRERRDAGELDWQAIGGTWGAATVRVGKWRPAAPDAVPYAGFQRILERIAEQSPLLSRYVEKYFHDMAQHCRSLRSVVRSGGSVHYIVGNSKFYDVLLPVEQIFAALLQAAGFERPTIETVRKRTSKKELFEFLVSARLP
jgi:hypothetical protein